MVTGRVKEAMVYTTTDGSPFGSRDDAEEYEAKCSLLSGLKDIFKRKFEDAVERINNDRNEPDFIENEEDLARIIFDHRESIGSLLKVYSEEIIMKNKTEVDDHIETQI
jgi:hypothetical protein